MVNTAQKHFTEEKPHTKIKHKLFRATLDTSMNIANGINYSKKETKPYIYIDLYAGAGKFKDEHKGSPLLALELFEKYKDKNKRTFSAINMIVAEKNEKNIEELTKNINNEKQVLLLDDLSCTFCSGSWETHAETLKNYIKSSQWGFVFVDPFSLELNFDNLIELINQSPYYKDILILINKSAQERVLGKINEPDISRLCNYFNISENNLKRLFDFVKSKGGSNETVVQHLIKRSISKLDKDYVINAAITRTRNGKLEDSNRFYLCLITSAIGVANSFLEKYAEELEDKTLKNNNMQLNLLNTSPITKYVSLEEQIENIIKHGELTLFELSKKLYNVFLSWKDSDGNAIPHRQALIAAINNLINNTKIIILNPQKVNPGCISSKTNKLLSKALTTKDDARSVILGLYR